MNCRQAEQWLLLKDTGELSFRKRLRLEKHLAGCPVCRAYRDDLGRAMALARQHLPAAEPGAQALAAIREAVRAGVPARRKIEWGWGGVAWRPVLAAAAMLLVCLGGWYWLSGRGQSSGGVSVAWEQPAVQTVSQSGEDSEDWMLIFNGEVLVIEPVSDLAARQEISPLDRDLLLLEGLAI